MFIKSTSKIDLSLEYLRLSRQSIPRSKIIILIIVILAFACSSSPKTPSPSFPSQKTQEQFSKLFMGPPSLLALTEGAIDTELTEDEKPQKTHPRLLLLSKEGRPLTVIQLWLPGGVLNEMSEEYGSTYVLHHFLTNLKNPKSLKQKIRHLGGTFNAWQSLDRYTLNIEITPNLVEATLRLLAEELNTLTQQKVIETAIEKALQDVEQTYWLQRRLTSRLVTSALNRLPIQNHFPAKSALIGQAELKELKPKQVGVFFSKILQPSRTQMLIAGEIDEKTVQQQVSTYFSQKNSTPEPLEKINLNHKVTPGASTVNSEKLADQWSVEIEALSAKTCIIHLAFPIDLLKVDEVSSLDLLSFILVGDQKGLIHRKAERAGLDLISASSKVIVTDKGSVFLNSIEVGQQQINDGWQILLEALTSLIHQPVSQRTLEQAKSIFERETLLIGDSLTSQIRRLGFFASHWPNKEGLSTYIRSAYQTRPAQLLDFAQQKLKRYPPQALLVGHPPNDTNQNLWQERLTEQLQMSMVQNQSKQLLGFSKHGPKLNLLFSPTKSDGVTSISVVIPIKTTQTRSSSHKVTSLALGHWFAALIGKASSNEPVFTAQSQDHSLYINATFPSHQIGEVFNALMRKIWQAPLRSEPQWQTESLEQARKHALFTLSLMSKDPPQKLRFLHQRLTMAFSKEYYPLPQERYEYLSQVSSSELVRWFKQHIQSQTMYIVVNGDVNESSLNRVLSPLSTANNTLTKSNKNLHLAPLPLSEHKLQKRCRELKVLSNQDVAWAALSYPIPKKVNPFILPLIETYLVKQQKDYFRKRVNPKTLAPQVLTLYLNSESKVFNKAWQQLFQDVEKLKTKPLSDSELRQLKEYASQQMAKNFSRTSTSAETLIQTWFKGLHNDKQSFQDHWSSEVQNITAENLFEAAKLILVKDQMKLVFIVPPYLKLTKLFNCQVVVP